MQAMQRHRFVETPTGTEKCSCYRQQYINHLFKQSNIKVLDVENFSTFNVNFYPDEIDEKSTESKSHQDRIF